MNSFLIFMLFSLIFVGIIANPLPNNEAIELKVYNKDNELFVDFFMGTPWQQVPVSLKYFDTDHDLRISRDDFDFESSSSYENAGKIKDPFGKELGNLGFDVFRLGSKNLTLPYKMEFVLQDDAVDLGTHLGFGLGENNVFWGAIYPQLPSHKITVVLDDQLSSGTITLGSLDNKRCKKHWITLDEQRNGDKESRFGVKIDKIVAGKYTYSYGSYNLVFKLNNDPFVWDQGISYQILKAFGGDVDNKTLSCNQTSTIDFNLKDNLVISLKPKNYLEKISDDTCKLIGNVSLSTDELSLSKWLFKDYCVSFDHFAKEVKFAEKLK